MVVDPHTGDHSQFLTGKYWSAMDGQPRSPR
jgi:hypothetical protein